MHIEQASILGQTALITGGAKRIGREIALTLARAGVNVVVHYRSSAHEAESLVTELRATGIKAWSVKANFSDPDQVDALLDEAAKLAGPINILINNASAYPKTEFETLTLDELMSSITVDAWAPFALGRQFGRSPQAKHIINLIDTRVFGEYDWRHFGYHAAKNMLALFTKTLAIKLAPQVAVNGVAPGLILPPEGKPQSYIEGLKGELPMQKIGSPDSVAQAVLFLLNSKFITGQVIFVDGGRHLREAGRG
ncbi:MAG: SDR family oxidoreductase [Armatimonadota bacterium]